MRADEWIVDYLVKKGVTDVFGIPGVVVMDFLYALDSRKPEITPHLCYHEQGAAFAACGYAQSTGKLGVAYATRGPGFTNMVTAIADAYYDSVPVMFITAHSYLNMESDMRVLNNQEIDTVKIVESITKKAVRIDDIRDLQKETILAYREAMRGRKGPVFLDIFNGLFSENIDNCTDAPEKIICKEDTVGAFVNDLEQKIALSERPVILIGNGARGEDNSNLLRKIAAKFKIPIISSRAGQDILPGVAEYFGFIGSRATRYSNFILSKADLIISLGNRLSFPVGSKSFKPVIENAYTIRVDIDNSEFIRTMPNCTNYLLDVADALSAMLNADLKYTGNTKWMEVCIYLKNKLDKWDIDPVIDTVMDIILAADSQMPIVCDVGNHSFWVTTAYSYVKAENRILYSGSFGTLGNALPKAIGAYYSTHKPVICFTGDQGIQYNIQELQYIATNKIPVTLVILNNCSSGMIMEREIAKYGDRLVHTTVDSGYSYPDFEKVALCYSMDYFRINIDTGLSKRITEISDKPTIMELIIDKDTQLKPWLPAGDVCQNLSPKIPEDLYNILNEL